MAFDQQGGFLAAGFFHRSVHAPSEVRIWDVSTRQVRLLGQLERFPDYLSVSPDARHVAAGSWSDGIVAIWDVKTAKKLWSFRGHWNPTRKRGAPHGLGFLADGTSLLTAGTDGMIRIWDISGKKEIRHFDGKVGGIEVMALSPDGKTVAVGQIPASGDPVPSDVRIWDVETGKQLGATRRLANGVSCMCFSKDGKHLAVGTYEADHRKGRIELWLVRK
jgi:WD40 repeat protein